jgi:hypothetical protein
VFKLRRQRAQMEGLEQEGNITEVAQLIKE